MSSGVKSNAKFTAAANSRQNTLCLPRVFLSLQDWKGFFLEEKILQRMSNMVAPQTLRREAAGNAPGEGAFTFEPRFVLHRIPQ